MYVYSSSDSWPFTWYKTTCRYSVSGSQHPGYMVPRSQHPGYAVSRSQAPWIRCLQVAAPCIRDIRSANAKCKIVMQLVVFVSISTYPQFFLPSWWLLYLQYKHFSPIFSAELVVFVSLSTYPQFFPLQHPGYNILSGALSPHKNEK